MGSFSIDAVRERLFNSTKHEKVVSRTSNPFAATSFKGNVLTADVFETKDKPSFTGKLKASALVSSISNIGAKIRSGIESVAEFGKKVKDSVIGGWNKLNEIEISIANPVKTFKESWNAMQDNMIVNNFVKKEPAQLETMLKNELGLSVAA